MEIYDLAERELFDRPEVPNKDDSRERDAGSCLTDENLPSFNCLGL